jgi:transposase
VDNERLRKENEKLARDLARTRAALEVAGKAHALLELLSGSADSGTKPPG